MTYYLDKSKFPKHLDPKNRKEIEKHRLIRMATTDKVFLFLHYNLPLLAFCCCKWKNKDKLYHMYQDGKYRIEKDLNLVRLVKTLKRIHILMKNSLMTSKRDFEIVHMPENCINVDEIEVRGSDDSHSSFSDTNSSDYAYGTLGIKHYDPGKPFLKERLTYFGKNTLKAAAKHKSRQSIEV